MASDCGGCHRVARFSLLFPVRTLSAWKCRQSDDGMQRRRTLWARCMLHGISWCRMPNAECRTTNEHPILTAHLTTHNPRFFFLRNQYNPLSSLMIGIIATVLLQSSSTVSAVIVALEEVGSLGVEEGIYMVRVVQCGRTLQKIVSLDCVCVDDSLTALFLSCRSWEPTLEQP